MNLPLINSHNGWDPLEEIWLGDIYPDSWYSHLPDEIEDTFCKINEITRKDLTIISNKLSSFGVEVVRPQYTDINKHVYEDQLRKPEITPRDQGVVYGNELFNNDDWDRTGVFSHAITRYQSDPGSHINYYRNTWRFQHDSSLVEEIKSKLEVDFISKEIEVALSCIGGANTVRYGNDIMLDFNADHPIFKRIFSDQGIDKTIALIKPMLQKLFPHSNLHLVSNGGHVDGCFTTLKPGFLMTSVYFDDYETYFPGWECINVNSPEFADWNQKNPFHQVNDRFWLDETKFSKAFNDHVIKYASDWVGEPTETIFEVNSLIVDENNILILGENEKVFRRLEDIGFTVHSMPFRARTFWDGGLHCLTVDIRRRSKFESYV
jgi:hypothetical protein